MFPIGVALTLLIVGQAPAPTPATASPAAIAAPPASSPTEPPTDPAAIAANLADMYEKSCGGRIYGTYAEACNNLAESLKQARAAARKAERAQRSQAAAGR